MYIHVLMRYVRPRRTWGEQNTEAEAFEQLDYALSKGVNFIDTAELYPVSDAAGCMTGVCCACYNHNGTISIT